MTSFYKRSFSSPGGSIDMDDQEERFSAEQRRGAMASNKSLSMATIQAQMSIAQTIRDMFHAARRNDNDSTDGDSSMENAWIQAVYNSVVMLIFGVVISVVVAVYYVLEPFLHPLLWAVLVGMFLYPFKRTATNHIEQWLNGLEQASVPLVAGIFISPLSFFNYVSSQLELYLTKYLAMFCILIGCIVSLYIMVTFNFIVFIQEVLNLTNALFTFIDEAVSFKWLIQVLVVLIIIGGVLCYIDLSKGSSSLMVKGIMITTWYLALSIISNIVLGYVGLPLVTVLFIVSFIVWLIQSLARKENKQQQKERIHLQELPPSPHRSHRKQSIFQTFNKAVLEDSFGITNGLEDDFESDNETKHVNIDNLPFLSGIEKQRGEENLRKRHNVQFHEDDATDSTSTEYEESTFHTSYPVNDPPTERKRSESILKVSEHSKEQITEQSSKITQIFLILISTYLVVLVWRHLWLLVIVFPAIARILVKRYFSQHSAVISTWYATFKTRLKSAFNNNKSIFFPQPIWIFFQVCMSLDRCLLRVMRSFVSPIISGSIIVAMIVGGVGAFVFFLLQVQVELAFSVGMMKDVLNSSVAQSPLMRSIIPGSEGGINSTLFNTHFEEFTDQGYHYGRDWLKHHVEFLVNDSTSGSNTAVVVNQILLLYDNFYHIYVFKNESRVSNLSHDHHEMEGLKEHLFHEVKSIVSDNMETIVSIMKGLWSVLSVNLSIAVSILSSLSQFIFSGGTMILNLVVFITALFYLLAYSGDHYLPEVWLLSIVPSFIAHSSERNYATSFANVIRSVFHASFNRACFYGLYTWLVLSVLEMEMTVVPSVLASVTGAIPFIGPYWVSIPAILELWLIRGSPLLAILAVILFLIPPFLIDTIINSEIQGGHAYLTGLAIAGGVYFAGLEGAIFGPILLCCLLFLVNFLTSQL